MKLTEAIQLIKAAPISENQAGVWADLGCGSGLFTQALASLLPAQSTIYAVDQQPQQIAQPKDKGIEIRFLQADFEKDADQLPSLQGVLMANSLHYVKDKSGFLKRLQPKLAHPGMFILVEYDSLRANPWVPYPISFAQAGPLCEEVGFTQLTKLGERPSRFRRGNIYAACCWVNYKKAMMDKVKYAKNGERPGDPYQYSAG